MIRAFLRNPSLRPFFKMATGGSPDISSFPDSSCSSLDSSDEERDVVNKASLWTRKDIKDKVRAELSQRSFGGTPYLQQSKKSQKKLLKIHMKRYIRKLQETGTTSDGTPGTPPALHEQESRPTKKDIKLQRRAKLQEAEKSGIKIAFDCSMEETMSPKQLSILARQIKYAYSSNIRSEKPFHLHLTGLKQNGKLNEAFNQQFQGFDRVIPNVTHIKHTEYFDAKNLIYLTPDSREPLTALEPEKVYVIGGLIDQNVEWHYTYDKAVAESLNTARLPIEENMIQTKSTPSKTVLTINQVMDILLDVNTGKTWAESLTTHLPKRKGYTLKNQ